MDFLKNHKVQLAAAFVAGGATVFGVMKLMEARARAAAGAGA